MEIKDEENDRLRLQLQELHKKIVQQAEDHEVCNHTCIAVCLRRHQYNCDRLSKNSPFSHDSVLLQKHVEINWVKVHLRNKSLCTF